MLCCCRVAVTLEMVDDYDAFCKEFRKSVHENQDQGNLDLGEHASCKQMHRTAVALGYHFINSQ